MNYRFIERSSRIHRGRLVSREFTLRAAKRKWPEKQTNRDKSQGLTWRAIAVLSLQSIFTVWRYDKIARFGRALLTARATAGLTDAARTDWRLSKQSFRHSQLLKRSTDVVDPMAQETGRATIGKPFPVAKARPPPGYSSPFHAFHVDCEFGKTGGSSGLVGLCRR